MSDYTDLPEIFKKNNSTPQPSALEQQATKVLTDLKEAYPEWTMVEVEAILEALQTAKKASSKERSKLLIEVVFRKSHDIKGQGTTFDYPLMTEVGQALCDLLRHKETFTDTEVKKAETYARMMQRILKEQMVGKGGKAGQALLKKIREE